MLLENGPLFCGKRDKYFCLGNFCGGWDLIFRLNGGLYTRYTNGCCECGWRVDIVAKIKDDRLEIVLSTSAFSS